MTSDKRDEPVQGLDALRRAYRRAGFDDEPPADLDTSIRAAARRAARPRYHQYLPPLAVAATIVVALGLLLRITALGPERVDPEALEDAAPRASAPAAPAEPSSSEAVAPVVTRMRAPAEDTATMRAEQAPAASGAAPAPAPALGERAFEAASPAAAGACAGARPMPPGAWLACIASALDAGSVEAARADLEAFEAEYPDYPVPGELADRLGP